LRRFGNRDILQGIDLDINKGEIFTLIGPSGSGKTTLIRLIDLLDVPSSGKILFDGQDTAANETSRLAIRRRMGMVFQKPAVMNTSVEENVAFGLRFRRVERSEREERVRSALGLVGLAHLSGRMAPTLSGGEMQRVAMARALVTQPEVLLLDEPTANLDPVNAEMIEDLILKVNRKFHTTIILSTHDMIQGQRLADRIGVIMNGQIVQIGTTNDIFYQPAGRAIARLVGIDAITGGVVTENKAGHALIRLSDTCFEVLTDLKEGQRAVLYIRPEEVTLTPAGDAPVKSSMRNRLNGRITRMVPAGPFVRVSVDCGCMLTALITRRSCTELGLTVGAEVVAGVKASAIHVLPEDETRTRQ